MRIFTNIASLNAQENINNNNKTLTSSLEKLSTGLKINKASDDASGLAIADKLRTQASSLNQSISNANSASALIQIADKAMAEQSNILDIVKQKLIQAGTDTTSSDGRESIRKDINKLLNQFDSIASQTNYNGITLLQKSKDDTAAQDIISFQIGENASFDIDLKSFKASNTDHLGGGTETFLGEFPGTPVAGGTTATNNLLEDESQQIRTDGSVFISSVDIAADNTENLSASSGLDIIISGNIGQIQMRTDGSYLDVSSESEAIQTTINLLSQTVAGLDYDTTNNILTNNTGGSQLVDLSGLDFSSANYIDNTAGALLEVNKLNAADTVFTIRNNLIDNTFGEGQLNIEGSSSMTGGKLLSDLKNIDTDQLTSELANNFMETVDEALTQLNTNRSNFGSIQNQMQSSLRNMQTTQTNLNSAESVIRDVDYAQESASFNKQNIIAQAGTYALSQANAITANVQKLLQ